MKYFEDYNSMIMPMVLTAGIYTIVIVLVGRF